MLVLNLKNEKNLQKESANKERESTLLQGLSLYHIPLKLYPNKMHANEIKAQMLRAFLIKRLEHLRKTGFSELLEFSAFKDFLKELIGALSFEMKGFDFNQIQKRTMLEFDLSFMFSCFLCELKETNEANFEIFVKNYIHAFLELGYCYFGDKFKKGF